MLESEVSTQISWGSAVKFATPTILFDAWARPGVIVLIKVTAAEGVNGSISDVFYDPENT